MQRVLRQFKISTERTFVTPVSSSKWLLCLHNNFFIIIFWLCFWGICSTSCIYQDEDLQAKWFMYFSKMFLAYCLKDAFMIERAKETAYKENSTNKKWQTKVSYVKTLPITCKNYHSWWKPLLWFCTLSSKLHLPQMCLKIVLLEEWRNAGISMSSTDLMIV